MTEAAKRILSFFLSVALVLVCLPAARGEDLPPEPTAETVPIAEETIPVEATEEIPMEAAEEATLPAEIPCEVQTGEEPALGPGLYFGLLRTHTTLSGGHGTAEDAFSFASGTDLDFFAVTDHSNAFGENDWNDGHSAAEAATQREFTALFGYEMSWPAAMQLGHIAVFGTSASHSWEESPFSSAGTALQNFYATLASEPNAIGMFCHPSTRYGTFSDFDHYSAAADNVMQLLEVFGDSDSEDLGYVSYIRALDKGWHVAPTANPSGFGSDWGCDSDLRTVVDAASLTEDGIYDALRSRRVYATEDGDLQILFSLDGAPMGSVVKLRKVGETADLAVSLQDSTDAAIGLVEVITEGGAVLTSQRLDSGYGQLCFSLPTDHPYYFLRITQPDGDRAVTAPIWIDPKESAGISALTCETDVPVQDQETVLSLALYNGESADLTVDTIEIFADGVSLLTDTSLACVPRGTSLRHEISPSFPNIGLTRVTAVLRGSLEGSARQYEAEVNISFRRSQQVTDILMDMSHQNADVGPLTLLRQSAAESDIRILTAEAGISAETLEHTRFLVIPAPAQPFSEEFLNITAEYIRYGGSLLICGTSAASQEINRLLETLGSSLRATEESVAAQTAEDCNQASLWWQGLAQGQIYRCEEGCAIDPGDGIWLVRKEDAHVLLAQEDTTAGGSIFLSCGFPFGDDALAPSRNLWQLPSANYVLLKNMLGIGGETLPLSTIRQVLSEASDEPVRIRGYVTAGTATPWNSFPDTLYLQDESGGIAVTPFPSSDIAPGTAVEVIGSLSAQGKNPVLKYSSHKLPDVPAHRYPAKTGTWDTLFDPTLHGGELVQAEGICRDVRFRSDGTLIRCTLSDAKGHTIQVLVEDGIGSHATGKNELHRSIRKRRTVRAIGILCVDEEGIPVIRVRNCEEVVWVPDRSADIPDTSDPLIFPVLLPACAVGMILNTLGYLAGCGLYLLAKRIFSRAKRN